MGGGAHSKVLPDFLGILEHQLPRKVLRLDDFLIANPQSTSFRDKEEAQPAETLMPRGMVKSMVTRNLPGLPTLTGPSAACRVLYLPTGAFSSILSCPW